ncbi:MAG: accessory factor UbiK family protein [Alphaproteobacteria bacterium]
MQTDNRLIDDLAKVAASTVGVLAGVREEVEARLRQQFERVLDGMELVNRDEFEAVKAMAAKARAENERLARRLAALEKAAGGGAAKPKATAAKPKAKEEKARKAAKKRSRGA